MLWIVNPKDKLKMSQALEEKIGKAQSFIQSVEASSAEGTCHLCGKNETSREHTPSKAAFNKHDLIVFKIAKPLQKFLRWEPDIQQGGNVNQSLCKSCNNLTGAWYNPAYVKLVRACCQDANEKRAGDNLVI